MMKEEQPHRGYLTTVFNCYCPRCRQGKLFVYPLTFRLKRNLHMHEHCTVCRQPTNIEVGFYYGTGYISYLIALLLSGASFLLWWLIAGFSFTDNRFVYWITFNSFFLLAAQPWLMRFSRSLWLSFFVHYDVHWPTKPPQNLERTNSAEKNNW